MSNNSNDANAFGSREGNDESTIHRLLSFDEDEDDNRISGKRKTMQSSSPPDVFCPMLLLTPMCRSFDLNDRFGRVPPKPTKKRTRFISEDDILMMDLPLLPTISEIEGSSISSNRRDQIFRLVSRSNSITDLAKAEKDEEMLPFESPRTVLDLASMTTLSPPPLLRHRSDDSAKVIMDMDASNVCSNDDYSHALLNYISLPNLSSSADDEMEQQGAKKIQKVHLPIRRSHATTTWQNDQQTW